MHESRGNEGRTLSEGWTNAAARADVREELESIYAECAARIAERGPACWASGRCCNFRATGHLLYVTGLEAAYAVRALELALRTTGVSPRSEPNGGAVRSLPVLSGSSLAEAEARGGCPFQQGNLCGAHPMRPLGCRVYFCDRSAQEWQQELSETLLRRIRELHDRRGIEYRYGEWRGMLGMFDESAR